MRHLTPSCVNSFSSTPSENPPVQNPYYSNTSPPTPTATMSFKMPDLNNLLEFSGGNFPQWFHGLKLRLRVGNDLGGVVIPPPANVMVEIIEAKISGAAAVFLSNSADLQAILVKGSITEEDLNILVKLFSDRFPSSLALEEQKNATQKQNAAGQMNPGGQKSPGEQLNDLSQGKDVSAEHYYQQALATLQAFNIEDKNYESLNTYEPPDSFEFLASCAWLDHVSFDPSPFIQKCVIASYLKGICDEELREEILRFDIAKNTTLAEVYDVIKSRAAIIDLRKKIQEEETAAAISNLKASGLDGEKLDAVIQRMRNGDFSDLNGWM